MEKISLKLSFSALIPAMALSLWGVSCGKGVKPAVAKKDPMASLMPVREFPFTELQRSVSNTFFLWRLDQNGKRIDGQTKLVGALADEANGIKSGVDSIVTQANRLIESRNNPNFCQECKDLYNDIDDGFSDLFIGMNQAFNAAREAVKVVKSDETKAYSKAKMSVVDQSLTRMNIQVASAAQSIIRSKEYQSANSKIQTIYDLQIKRQPLMMKFELLALKLAHTVDFYQSAPTTVLFKPGENGQHEIKIDKWSLDFRQTNNEKATTFSTELGNVKNVEYRAMGGRWKFDLQIPEKGQVYSFTLYRARYAETDKNGGAIYSGDFIIRDTATGLEIRSGVAKISAK
jgi:hypothetical protein